jgi:multiple sugar transport system ATP-binding protein
MAGGISIANIVKAFGSTRVLCGVSIDVREGEFLSLVGPSGCGKSTLLRIIAGLEWQDSGSIAIAGNRVDALPPRERNIAMVFQNYALYPHMTAGENIATPLVMDGLSLFERLPLLGRLSLRRAAIAARIAEDVERVARQLHIEALLDRKPGQLSGGQRQRVALARAMVRQPAAFLMDEPLSNLDAKLRVHMRDELSELHKRLGATFVYVTHDQVEAMTMSDRVALMDGGRVLQLGTPTELYERPCSLTVAQFIGSPTINTLPVTSDTQGGLHFAGMRLGIDVPLGQCAAKMALRPEAIRLSAGNSAPGRIRLSGRLRRVEHHGAERIGHLILEVGEERAIQFRLPAEDARGLEEGQAVDVCFHPQDAHLFDAAGIRVEAALRQRQREYA